MRSRGRCSGSGDVVEEGREAKGPGWERRPVIGRPPVGGALGDLDELFLGRPDALVALLQEVLDSRGLLALESPDPLREKLVKVATGDALQHGQEGRTR